MSKTWVEGICNETAGFLFKHECLQYPQNRCDACGKPICEEHTRRFEVNTYCPACDAIEARARGRSVAHRYDDDSYYHGDHYYHGYGYYGTGRHHLHHAHERDPNALNAGDAESLRNEGDEDFEADMSES